MLGAVSLSAEVAAAVVDTQRRRMDVVKVASFIFISFSIVGFAIL
jgi:hypothetical protein